MPYIQQRLDWQKDKHISSKRFHSPGVKILKLQRVTYSVMGGEHIEVIAEASVQGWTQYSLKAQRYSSI